jgi:hypothetical protein
MFEHPEEGDQVIEEAGAGVFVEPDIVVYPEDKTLDATVAGDRVQFRLSEQTRPAIRTRPAPRRSTSTPMETKDEGDDRETEDRRRASRAPPIEGRASSVAPFGRGRGAGSRRQRASRLPPS